MKGIVRDCIREMSDRKIFWIYGVLTVIVLLMIIATRSFTVQFGVDTGAEADPFAEVAGAAALRGLSSYVSFLVFLTVLATAGVFPNMFVRGRAEFYLSKPISRANLYLGKLLGVWLVYGGVVVMSGVLVYLALFAVHGIADWHVVHIFLMNLAGLIIWLSVTTFAGIAFGTNALSLMTAFIIWVLQLLLRFHDGLDMLINSKLVVGAAKVLYYIVPKTGEISDLTDQLAAGQPVRDWMPLWSSLLFSLALIWATVIIFRRKDY